MTHLKLLAASFFTIIVLDFIWLGFIASKFYTENLGPIARLVDGKIVPVYWAAVVVYVFLSLGIVYFVLPKLDSSSGYLMTFFTGALLGLVIYGVYDFTNYSTLKDFPLKVAFADAAWGSIVCGFATLAAAAVRDI